MDVLQQIATELIELLEKTELMKEDPQSYLSLNDGLKKIKITAVCATDDLLDMLGVRECYGVAPEVRLYSDEKGFHVGNEVYPSCISMRTPPTAIVGVDVGTSSTACAYIIYSPVQLVVFEHEAKYYAVIDHYDNVGHILFAVSLELKA
ncbi:MAG: hypothetical protein LBG64_02090 [Pseudomonadales bacterium]|jgi:hypothetical protein|nr:hypothetical protein [Pseudomonadales bacterium]